GIADRPGSPQRLRRQIGHHRVEHRETGERDAKAAMAAHLRRVGNIASCQRDRCLLETVFFAEAVVLDAPCCDRSDLTLPSFRAANPTTRDCLLSFRLEKRFLVSARLRRMI
ncbi:MAG TPA: hypothetical protein VIM38_05965, partial [Alphaproteobacteria bacterium]